MKYISFSGGADSTATAILWKQENVEFELLFADTGVELPETYWTVLEVSKKLGVKLNVVQYIHGGFLPNLIHNGKMLPGRSVRWCTYKLKRQPSDKFVEEHHGELAIGITADEGHRAEGKSEKPFLLLFPLVEKGITKDDTFKICRKEKLLNPCYSWRSSCSCFCCLFQRLSDWRGLLKKHPDLYRLSEKFEEVSKSQFRSDRSLKEIRTTEESRLKLYTDAAEDEPCNICMFS
ncbi:MAG: phosphoadenosine phosphosulfate reductase family protein [bacterium]